MNRKQRRHAFSLYYRNVKREWTKRFGNKPGAKLRRRAVTGELTCRHV